MKLVNKKILLGVCGGVAAYKAPEIVRRLQDSGAEVRVVMTRGACEFVRPLTFQAVSGQEVLVELLDERAEAAMGHIELARWADLVLIAPATANTMAKVSAGVADNLITTLCLATRSPLLIAPSMNNGMWENPATQANVAQLEKRGVQLLGPASGAQACGEFGPGRMLEPSDIVAECKGRVAPSAGVTFPANTHVLLTAGPTREAIDPVRFITNHSSGKMGFQLASAAANAGASVTLVAGPVNLPTPVGVNRVDVTSAAQMHDAVLPRAAETDIFIAVAAVADYRLLEQQDHKIKKTADAMVLELTRNPDILADVAGLADKPFCVGFAAETHDVLRYARDKLERKRLDMIVANRVGVAESGFNSDDNTVEVLWQPDGSRSFGLQSKQNLAAELVALIVERYARSKV